MPIYEYEAIHKRVACPECRDGFEVLQILQKKPISRCPRCGARVKKIISRCRAAVVERSQEHLRVEGKVKEYERAGMWSHAAELADKQSEKTRDKNLRIRALENYEKAGYDSHSLEKHAKFDDK